MFNKTFRIIRNFYKISKLNEILYLLLYPLIIVIISYFLKIPYVKLESFLNDFNGMVISVVTLLAAFGIASITLIFSSSSENIKGANNQPTKRKSISGYFISYYQLILAKSYYALICQLILLSISIFCKVILISFANIYIFYILLFLLTHCVIAQINVVISLYYLMWKDN